MKKRWLMLIFFIIILAGLVLFGAKELLAPEDQKNTQAAFISTDGTLVCLPHKDQSGPQTMECAYGIQTDDGKYYGLQDTTANYELITRFPMNTRVHAEGGLGTVADDRYQSSGVIQLVSLEQVN